MSTLVQSNPDLAVHMINECLEEATKFEGEVFGGYVRDVIVPRLANPKCKVEFKDVDVWFRTQENADNFVKVMGKSFVEATRVESPSMYKFIRQQYMFFRYNTFIVCFDVIVSPILPVDDFNVNQLTYGYNGNEFRAYALGDQSVDDLKRAIHTKIAKMLPGYKEKLTRPYDGKLDVAQIHINRLKTRYLERGWTIQVQRLQGDIVVPKYVNLTWCKENLVDCLTIDVKSLTVVNSPTTGIKTSDQSEDKSRADALNMFNAGVESMRNAFMKLLDSK